MKKTIFLFMALLMIVPVFGQTENLPFGRSNRVGKIHTKKAKKAKHKKSNFRYTNHGLK